MRILVCGGRDYGNLVRLKGDREDVDWPRLEAEYTHIMRTLDKLAIQRSKHNNPNDNWLPTDFLIISGAASGADTVAIDWAVVNWCEFQEYRADWKAQGKAAGPIRNQRMLDDGKPELVIAFPGGKGTADMVSRAKKAGLEVIEVGA